MSSRTGGEFGAVARVLFDSAAKTGIVDPSQKKEFARQVQKLAGQSKRKGGSLGSVTFKMAEFVEREVPALRPPRTPGVTGVKPVPLINLSFLRSSKPTLSPDRSVNRVGAGSSSSSGVDAAGAAAAAVLRRSIPSLADFIAPPTSSSTTNVTTTRLREVPGAHSEGLRRAAGTMSLELPKPLSPLAPVPAPPNRHRDAATASAAPSAKASTRVSPSAPASAADPPPQAQSAHAAGTYVTVGDDEDETQLRARSDTRMSAFASEEARVTVPAALAAPLAGAPTVFRVQPMSPAPPHPRPVVAPPVTSPPTAAPLSFTNTFSPTTGSETTSFGAFSGALAGSSESVAPSWSSIASIDSWETQRDTEIEALRMEQQRQEEKAAAEREAREWERLGEAWATRSLGSEHLAESAKARREADPWLSHHETLFFSADWMSAAAAFESIVHRANAHDAPSSAKSGEGTATPLITEYALRLVHQKHLRAPHQRRAALQRWLAEFALKPAKSDSVSRSAAAAAKELSESMQRNSGLRVMHNPLQIFDGDQVGASSSSLQQPSSSPSLLQRQQPRDAVAAATETFRSELSLAVEEQSWERAVNAYDAAVAACAPQVKGTPRNATALERALAKALALCKGIPLDRMHTLRSNLVEAAKSRLPGRTLDRETTLALLRFVRGRSARNILPSIEAKWMDEQFLAFAIEASDEEETLGILESAQRCKLNVRDPRVVAALARKALRSSTPMRCMTLLEEQLNEGTRSPLFLSAAAMALSAHPSAEMAQAYLRIQRVLQPCVNDYVLRLVIPKLCDLGLHDAVVSLYDAQKDSIQFEAALPTTTLYVNSSLKALGRKLLHDKDASTIVAAGGGGAAASATGAATVMFGGRELRDTSTTASPPLDQFVSTDVMLEYAKERNWRAALAALASLPQRVAASQRTTQTLLYNCALSAATDEPSIVHHILQTMADLRVDRNATTYNTAIGAVGKQATDWGTALSLFAEMPPSLRDAGTYSVLLSTLARHELWEEATAAFQELRSLPGGKTPSVAVYGLGILATHKHSWSATLGLFQQMLKSHGASNVKEVVLLRVLRSLEDSKRHAEIQWVERAMEKGKKKGKK